MYAAARSGSPTCKQVYAYVMERARITTVRSELTGQQGTVVEFGNPRRYGRAARIAIDDLERPPLWFSPGEYELIEGPLR